MPECGLLQETKVWLVWRWQEISVYCALESLKTTDHSKQTYRAAQNGTTVHFVDTASVNMGQFKLTGRESDSSLTADVHSTAPPKW